MNFPSERMKEKKKRRRKKESNGRSGREKVRSLKHLWSSFRRRRHPTDRKDSLRIQFNITSFLSHSSSVDVLTRTSNSFIAISCQRTRGNRGEGVDTSAIKFANFNTSSFLVRISSSSLSSLSFRLFVPRIECVSTIVITTLVFVNVLAFLNKVLWNIDWTARIEMFVEEEFDKYI